MVDRVDAHFEFYHLLCSGRRGRQHLLDMQSDGVETVVFQKNIPNSMLDSHEAYRSDGATAVASIDFSHHSPADKNLDERRSQEDSEQLDDSTDQTVVVEHVATNGHELTTPESPDGSDTAHSHSSEPPTPPSKPAVEVLEHLEEQRTTANIQNSTADAPPPPVAKSPPIPRAQTGAGVRSSTATTSPSSTSFNRSSISESLASPTTAHGGHNRSLTMSQGNTVSVVLIQSALETIAASREARRSAPLKEAVDRALSLVKVGQGGDQPRLIFEPLRLACETGNEKLMIASLDCISKLISYSFFLEPGAPNQVPMSPPPISPAHGAQGFATESQANLRSPTLVDDVAHTITMCHTETTPDAVSLQIVKALLSLVLSSKLLVHQSSLLKAVRTVYNIFLLSPDAVNQTVAQGGLTQMVHHVFTRVKLGGQSLESADGSVPQSPRPNGIRSKSSSNRPSLTPSTPDIYPLPPLTPPIGITEQPKIQGESEQSFPEGAREPHGVDDDESLATQPRKPTL